MIFFFKLIYWFRKKLNGIINIYLFKESICLFPDKIYWGKGIVYDEFPEFNIDSTKTNKVEFGDSIGIRGKMNLLVLEGGSIKIGKGSFFNRGCSLNSMKLIQIGENCMLGENVKIYDHDHKYKDSSVLIKEQGYSRSGVVIEDNCWLGSNVIVLKGSFIGAGSVIGAGCIIRGIVPAGSIVYSDSSNQIVQKINFEV